MCFAIYYQLQTIGYKHITSIQFLLQRCQSEKWGFDSHLCYAWKVIVTREIIVLSRDGTHIWITTENGICVEKGRNFQLVAKFEYLLSVKQSHVLFVIQFLLGWGFQQQEHILTRIMDPDRVRAYLQVACAGLGFDIGEIWWTTNAGTFLVGLWIYASDRCETYILCDTTECVFLSEYNWSNSVMLRHKIAFNCDCCS